MFPHQIQIEQQEMEEPSLPHCRLAFENVKGPIMPDISQTRIIVSYTTYKKTQQ